jgi:hypothetical protein
VRAARCRERGQAHHGGVHVVYGFAAARHGHVPCGQERNAVGQARAPLLETFAGGVMHLVVTVMVPRG